MEESNRGKLELGCLMKLTKWCTMRNDNSCWSFVNWPLEFWIYFACPFHGESSLSLLVNQFQGSWIPFQVGWWRGHLDLSLDISKGFLVAVLQSIHSNSHLSPYSLIPSSPLPHTLMFMAHFLDWCLHFSDDIWGPRLDIWCVNIKYYVHMLYKSKCQKSICESIAFPMLLND